jgi:hypothetical protein
MGKGSKTKTKNEPPNAQQLLRLLAGHPTEMEVEMNHFPTTPPRSMTQVARLMGCSTYYIRKTLLGILDVNDLGGDIDNLSVWKPKGVPLLDLKLSMDGLAYALDRNTLRA